MAPQDPQERFLDSGGAVLGTVYATAADEMAVHHESSGNELLVTSTGMELPTGDFDMGGGRITSVGAPTSANDAARKAYVDGVAQGLTLKDSVRAAPTTNIDLASATDPNPADGVTLNDGDRVLLKEQTSAVENGIYDAVTATDPTTWVRSADADEDSEVASGMFTFVEEGTTNGGSSFIVTTDDPITVDTTAITFSQFASAGEILGGDGLTKSGQTLDINVSDFAGSHLSDDGSNNLTVDDDFVENSGDTISGTLSVDANLQLIGYDDLVLGNPTNSAYASLNTLSGGTGAGRIDYLSVHSLDSGGLGHQFQIEQSGGTVLTPLQLWDNYLDMSNANYVKLPERTSDPSAPAGAMWYRTDLD